MTLYSVFLGKQDEPLAVADRFSWFAALFPLLYGLVHGLWLMLLLWLLLVAGAVAVGVYAGPDAVVAMGFLVALFFGLEGPTFRRARLRRRYRYLGDALARTADLAALHVMAKP